MDFSELTIKLIMLLIPGAICTIIIEKLTVHKPWSPFKFVVNVILTGCLTYLIYQLGITTINKICNRENYILLVWENLTNEEIIPYNEIIVGSIISIFLGLLLSAFIQFKILNKIAKRLRITEKYGDENLYSYFLNSPITDEVYIRNIETGMTYHGLVHSYSEDEKNKEIVLSSVTVYDSESGKELYDLHNIYICKVDENIIIELPHKINNENGEEI